MMIALHRSPSQAKLLVNTDSIVVAFTGSYPGRECSVVKTYEGIYEVSEAIDEVERVIGSAKGTAD